MNNLDAACVTLRVGQVIKVPYPTPTPPPPPTSTLEPDAATKAACATASYTVQANDTLSSIAANYNVSMASIREFNNLPTDNVLLGQTLLIPLCERAPDPNLPTPTPTPPPPYPAPNLLLPIDGAAFTLAHDIVTLQWASLGVLREGEAYQIIIEDVTADQGRRIVEYVTDTSFIIPTTSARTIALPTSCAGGSSPSARPGPMNRVSPSGHQPARQVKNGSLPGLGWRLQPHQNHNPEKKHLLPPGERYYHPSKWNSPCSKIKRPLNRAFICIFPHSIPRPPPTHLGSDLQGFAFSH